MSAGPTPASENLFKLESKKKTSVIAPKVKSAVPKTDAKEVLPFDDDIGKVGTTDGF